MSGSHCCRSSQRCCHSSNPRASFFPGPLGSMKQTLTTRVWAQFQSVLVYVCPDDNPAFQSSKKDSIATSRNLRIGCKLRLHMMKLIYCINALDSQYHILLRLYQIISHRIDNNNLCTVRRSAWVNRHMVIHVPSIVPRF